MLLIQVLVRYRTFSLAATAWLATAPQESKACSVGNSSQPERNYNLRRPKKRVEAKNVSKQVLHARGIADFTYSTFLAVLVALQLILDDGGTPTPRPFWRQGAIHFDLPLQRLGK